VSLIHSTIVGHFDPTKLIGPDRPILRQLDLAAAKALLLQYPEIVADHVEFYDGYAECWWADRSFRILDAVYEYAYRLAREQGCIAAETPVCYIAFPEEAKQVQATALRKLSENRQSDEGRPPISPVRLSVPKGESVPCPCCGEPLRTPIARQCRFCKMDWHDSGNVYRRC